MRCERCGHPAYYVTDDGRGFCTVLHLEEAIGEKGVGWIAEPEKDGVRRIVREPTAKSEFEASFDRMEDYLRAATPDVGDQA